VAALSRFSSFKQGHKLHRVQ